MGISKAAIRNLSQLYIGELVVVYLKGMNIVVSNEDVGHMDVTPMLQGIIMDIDESFIHLGDGGQILKSIKHDDYGVIELAMPPDPFMDLDISSSEIN